MPKTAGDVFWRFFGVLDSDQIQSLAENAITKSDFTIVPVKENFDHIIPHVAKSFKDEIDATITQRMYTLSHTQTSNDEQISDPISDSPILESPLASDENATHSVVNTDESTVKNLSDTSESSDISIKKHSEMTENKNTQANEEVSPIKNEPIPTISENMSTNDSESIVEFDIEKNSNQTQLFISPQSEDKIEYEKSVNKTNLNLNESDLDIPMTEQGTDEIIEFGTLNDTKSTKEIIENQATTDATETMNETKLENTTNNSIEDTQSEANPISNLVNSQDHVTSNDYNHLSDIKIEDPDAEKKETEETISEASNNIDHSNQNTIIEWLEDTKISGSTNPNSSNLTNDYQGEKITPTAEHEIIELKQHVDNLEKLIIHLYEKDQPSDVTHNQIIAHNSELENKEHEVKSTTIEAYTDTKQDKDGVESNINENQEEFPRYDFEDQRWVEKVKAAQKMLELNFEPNKVTQITGIDSQAILAYEQYLEKKEQEETDSDIIEFDLKVAENDNQIEKSIAKNELQPTNQPNEEVNFQDIEDANTETHQELKIEIDTQSAETIEVESESSLNTVQQFETNAKIENVGDAHEVEPKEDIAHNPIESNIKETTQDESEQINTNIASEISQSHIDSITAKPLKSPGHETSTNHSFVEWLDRFSKKSTDMEVSEVTIADNSNHNTIEAQDISKIHNIDESNSKSIDKTTVSDKSTFSNLKNEIHSNTDINNDLSERIENENKILKNNPIDTHSTPLVDTHSSIQSSDKSVSQNSVNETIDYSKSNESIVAESNTVSDHAEAIDDETVPIDAPEIDYIDRNTEFDSNVMDFINNQKNNKKTKNDTNKSKAKNKITYTDNESFVSETMALLYHKQGYIDKSIRMYQKLIEQFPEKSAYFAAKIENIKK